MKTYTHTDQWNTRTYEIVDRIPEGYFVWNIGKNMGCDDLIPLCEKKNPKAKRGESGYYDVNVDTLKAIKLDPEQVELLRSAAHYGVTDIKAARRAAKLNPKTGYSKVKKNLAESTLNIFESLA